jgi:Na+/H+-dicarboxylate symporter
VIYLKIVATLLLTVFLVIQPLLAISWSLSEQGAPPGILRLAKEASFVPLIEKWPDFTLGQKLFLFAFSVFCATLGVAAAWIGVAASPWVNFLLNGMSHIVEEIPQPFGAWIPLLGLQILMIVIFYTGLEFWPRKQ